MIILHLNLVESTVFSLILREMPESLPQNLAPPSGTQDSTAM